MGATESRHGNSDEDSDDDGSWMQADKYAEWTCADSLDFNGTAIMVRHVEMPLNAQERTRITESIINTTGIGEKIFGGSGFTHEALVFDVQCSNGKVVKFTVELTFSGVMKRWGHHKIISSVKGEKAIFLAMPEVTKIIETPRPYNLVMFNCKHYAVEKFKKF